VKTGRRSLNYSTNEDAKMLADRFETIAVCAQNAAGAAAGDPA